MKRKMTLFSTYLIILLFFIASCAPTLTRSTPTLTKPAITLTYVWKYENYQGGPFKKAFVLVAVQDPVFKRLCEDEFVKQLTAHGTGSTASYTVYLTHFKSDKESITSKIKAVEADAVLITRLIKVDNESYVPEEKYDIPDWYYDWYSYYSSGFGLNQGPSYKDENFSIIMETNMYDAKNEKLIWVARSDVLLVTCIRCQDITSPIKVIVDQLSSDQLIE
jgi:hypothetical protein